MFRAFSKLPTYLTVKVQGAYCEEFLSGCADEGIELRNVITEKYSAQFEITPHDAEAIKAIAARTQTEIVFIRTHGARRAGKAAVRHIIGLCVLLLLLGLLAFSRAFIWEIEVTGNSTIPTGDILAALRCCGVEYGAFWPGFRSDDIRNRAMELLPEAAWLTVNISGSRAEVIVRERVKMPEMVEDGQGADICARFAGYITKVSCLEGEALVKPGDLVQPGQILISGTLDSIPGNVRTVHALGDVWAETYRENSAISPLVREEKTYTGEKYSNFALILGKYRINFCGNSSIYEGDCDKIRSEYILGVKGLFVLPVRIEKVTSVCYTVSPVQREAESISREMGEYLKKNSPEAFLSYSVTDKAVTACARERVTQQIGVTVPHD